MTDEHAMKVAEKAYSAGNLVTCDGYYEFDLDAATAVIAREFEADWAKIEELEAENAKLREAVGILEDGLQKVGDDYPGSSCQEWCQHLIKQARAALKDTRNDADA